MSLLSELQMNRIRLGKALCYLILPIIILFLIGALIFRHFAGPAPIHIGLRPDAPAQLAHWPWPHAKIDHPHPGVTHWIDRSSSDGTAVELFDFDFRANPHLRLELYDQDEDDKTPFDDKCEFWPQGVAQAAQHLNKIGRGPVVAAWNGSFFQYRDIGGHRIGSHIAPVVLRGHVYYNVGLVRWAVGVKYDKTGPVFTALHMPSKDALANTYDFAAEGASCLIDQGKPLRLAPFPPPGQQPSPSRTACAPDEAGYVRIVDHIRTSRTSMAWSRDNRHLYLLIVKDPGAEAISVNALLHNLPVVGGWTVADLQRFWQSLSVWGAVNIDGGDCTALVARRADGRYDYVPAFWGDTAMRRMLPADLSGASRGGSMMYFYVRDTENSAILEGK
jgi:hypothetical protein